MGNALKVMCMHVTMAAVVAVGDDNVCACEMHVALQDCTCGLWWCKHSCVREWCGWWQEQPWGEVYAESTCCHCHCHRVCQCCW